jgi:hypothetical protein
MPLEAAVERVRESSSSSANSQNIVSVQLVRPCS